MPAGRPAKPLEQKRRLGNPGKRALPAASNLAAVPAATPADHELSLTEALERVFDTGAQWIAQTDLPTVALLREALEHYSSLKEIPGVPPKELREGRLEIAKYLSQLGFDPTARSRLGLAEVKARSKLDELRARHATP